MTLWTKAHLDPIVAWLEDAYPEEGCGLIFQKEDDSFEVKCCENLANKYHKLDPETFPRTAKTFYMINPMEFTRADKRGDAVTIVFHSHCDVGDYFSDEDVAAATMPQFEPDYVLEPSHPGTDYLVVSVREGKADRAQRFTFDEDSASFITTQTIHIHENGTYNVTNGPPES